MTTQHTPLIRLQAARTAYYRAQEACPHWDYDSDFEPGNDRACGCCYDLEDARRELKLAKRAALAQVAPRPRKFSNPSACAVPASTKPRLRPILPRLP